MKIHEECAVFACIVKNNRAFDYIKYGLTLLQHRGEESAGITCGGKNYKTIKNTGLVEQVFKNVEAVEGDFGIGHVRYSTQGSSDKVHAQPFQEKCKGEDIALAHNGNISKILQKKEAVFSDMTDSEIILKCLISEINKKPSLWTFEDITEVLYKNFDKGAYSLVIALPERIIGIKDPSGYRPLMFCIAREGYFLASEDCAFESLHIHKIIEIQAGECIEITKDNYKIQKYCKPEYTKQCVFEHIYFANPASSIFSKNVYETRVELGRLMAKEDKVKADIIVPVMSSGLAAALGYSEISKIPMHLGLKKNKAFRSFIQPTRETREKIAVEKYIPIKSVIENKRIILVDDSIVRGTTMMFLTRLLKKHGAKEIHIRLSSPAIINTCFWGIDIPYKNELIFRKFKDEKSFAEFLGAESVKFIPKKFFNEVFNPEKWCYNCFME